jgi:SAM-dependent methyltransferase
MKKVGTANESQRDDWVRQKLRELPADWRLLDAGAGEQRYRQSCHHLHYVAQDFAEYQPGVVSTGLHSERWDYRGLDIISDIASIPRDSATFDAILCTEVFEHIPEPSAAIREFARLLRPGGKLILTAPFISLTHLAPYHFATGFNRFFYEKHLSDHGLRIDEVFCNGNYFELVAQELRRVSSVADRYANSGIRKWERWAMRMVLRMLARFSRQDRGSSELACFGLHILATRLDPAIQAAA